MKIKKHQLENVEFCPSPHFNERPNPKDISLLVIHNISLPPGEFGGHFIENFFQGKLTSTCHPYFDEIREMQVSAHCLIKRDGTIIQFVPFDKRAWHAGISRFGDREQCNDFSIGIELEGTDEFPYTYFQYNSLRDLTKALMKNYPKITMDKIVGHQHIAPERKTDPGLAFNWNKYKELLIAPEPQPEQEITEQIAQENNEKSKDEDNSAFEPPSLI